MPSLRCTTCLAAVPLRQSTVPYHLVPAPPPVIAVHLHNPSGTSPVLYEVSWAPLAEQLLDGHLGTDGA